MSNRLMSSGLAALSFTVSAGLLALALTPSVASAASTKADGDVVATITGNRAVAVKEVSTAGLDLTDARDLQRLNTQVRVAIKEVCSNGDNGRIGFAEARCRDEARASSDRQIAALQSQAVARMAANQAPVSSKIAVVAAR